MVIVTSSRNYEIADAEGNPVKGDKAAIWHDGLVDVLDELGGSADRVILIGETPHYRQDPVECLATHDVIEECIEPRSTMVSRRYQSLERSAAEAAGADLIEPIDWLCQESTCAPVMEHYLVYRNPGHLTATIATVLAPQMRWAIEGLP